MLQHLMSKYCSDVRPLLKETSQCEPKLICSFTTRECYARAGTGAALYPVPSSSCFLTPLCCCHLPVCCRCQNGEAGKERLEERCLTSDATNMCNNCSAVEAAGAQYFLACFFFFFCFFFCCCSRPVCPTLCPTFTPQWAERYHCHLSLFF